MTNTPKLSDFDLVVLTAAAGRKDLRVIPLPDSLKGDHETLKLPLKDLLRRGLIAEQSTKKIETIWRKTETGGRLVLVISDAGLAAIDGPPAKGSPKPGNAEEGAGKKPSQPKRSRTRTSSTTTSGKRSSKPQTQVSGSLNGAHTPDPKKLSDQTKGGRVIKRLQRKTGATVGELMELTGWQAHSVRGFMSGVVRRKYGLPLTSDKKPGQDRRYRIKADGEK